jgi:hypothetical protein
LIVVVTGTTTAAASYEFPIDHHIRPAVKLPDLAVPSFDPANKIAEERVVGVTAVSLGLMANLRGMRRQLDRPTAVAKR